MSKACARPWEKWLWCSSCFTEQLYKETWQHYSLMSIWSIDHSESLSQGFPVPRSLQGKTKTDQRNGILPTILIHLESTGAPYRSWHTRSTYTYANTQRVGARWEWMELHFNQVTQSMQNIDLCIIQTPPSVSHSELQRVLPCNGSVFVQWLSAIHSPINEIVALSQDQLTYYLVTSCNNNISQSKPWCKVYLCRLQGDRQ